MDDKEPAEALMPATVPERRRARKFPFSLLDAALRRAMDLAVSLVGLVLLSPLMALIAVRIRRMSPGPVLYRGLRAGRGGKNFKMLKFRTMFETPQSYQGLRVTAKGDPRITPFGGWLRSTKLNELPQLWNVLRGEMSLVGPRPEDPFLVKKWPQGVRQEILSVRPGITSPASVVYRDEENLLQSADVMNTYLIDILPSKLRLDLLYVRNRTLLSDVDVIFLTLVALLPRLGALAIPENLLFWGPLSRFTNRFFNWFILDFIIASLAIGISGIIWRFSAPLDVGLLRSAFLGLAMALLFSIINALVGTNRIAWSKARYTDTIDLAISSALTTGVIFGLNFVWADSPVFPPGMVVMSGLLAFIGFVIIRFRTRLLTGVASRWLRLRGDSVGKVGEHTLIIGTGEMAQFAAWLFQVGPVSKAFTNVGLVDDEHRNIGMKIRGSKVIGTTKMIPDLVRQQDVGLILFAMPDLKPDYQQHLLSICQRTGAHVVQVADMLDALRFHLVTDDRQEGELYTRVMQTATTDRTTGGYSQRQLSELAARELARARRYHVDLSILHMRVDYPVPQNRSEAIIVKHQILREAATRTMAEIREVDTFGRYDGNEFAILLPETDRTEAACLADRLRKELEARPCSTEYGPVELKILLSIAQADEQDREIADVLTRATELNYD